ncbi:hypothetical protein BH23GEM2_BH23GEM2_11960 [soil metagenome]
MTPAVVREGLPCSRARGLYAASPLCRQTLPPPFRTPERGMPARIVSFACVAMTIASFFVIVA